MKRGVFEGAPSGRSGATPPTFEVDMSRARAVSLTSRISEGALICRLSVVLGRGVLMTSGSVGGLDIVVARAVVRASRLGRSRWQQIEQRGCL